MFVERNIERSRNIAKHIVANMLEEVLFDGNH